MSPGAGARRDAAGGDAARIQELEGWFGRNGMPHLSVDYDPREDTLTRLRPVLLGLFFLVLVATLRPEWPWWASFLGACVGLAIAVAGIVALNVARGQPAFRRPERVSFLEAAVFLVAPAAAELILGDVSFRPLWIALATFGIAVVLYVLMSLGVVTMVVRLSSAWLHGLGATASVAFRAMPPVLAVLLFLFLATEVWQAFGLLEGWRFGSVLVVFTGLGIAFLVVALRRELHDLVAPVPSEETRALALRTPAAPLVEEGVVPRSPVLSRMARLNVLIAMLVSLGGRVIAVGVVIGGFFMLFGMLVVSLPLTEEWTGRPANVLLSITLRGGTVVITEELVRVSTLLGAFAALYFIVVALTEAARRQDFLDDEIDRVSGVMAAWTYYRGLVDPGGDGERPGAGATGILPRP